MWKEKLDMLPDYMQGAMERYIERGIMPGSFLTSILTNDLFGAVSNADSVNKRVIADYVMYLYNYAPGGCWGSVQRMNEWTSHNGLEKYSE